MYISHFFIVILLTVIPSRALSIANTSSDQLAETLLHEGTILFSQRQYAVAQKYFNTYLHGRGKKYNQEKAAYYALLSALKNKDPHIKICLQYFITKNPTSHYAETMRYYLAESFAESGLLNKSRSLYENIKVERLMAKERITFPYAIGNLYLKLKDWDHAKESFKSIQDINHPYYYPAQLQMAYLAFETGDYDGALSALTRASKKYASESQSLTLKVYHKAAQYEALLGYIQGYSPSVFNQKDQLLIGDAYFFLKQYAKAIHHYQVALDDKTDNMTRAKLGHALYAIEQYAQAVDCLKPLRHHNDHASQIAAYYSGLIYEKQDEIRSAIAAFAQAAQLRFDQELNELATIKLASLRYQQGAISEVIASMTNFIAGYQQSKNLSTAQVILVQCYYTTKAYQLAIDYITGLPYKTEALLKLYQKVLFYQGLQDYNENKLDNSIKCLKHSLLFPFKASLVLQAQFWLGEAFSALGKYAKALKCYEQSIQESNCSNTLYYEKNLYGLAYSYFNTGNYTSAATTFEQYVKLTQKQPAASHYDAMLRLGDCYYVQKNYTQALKLYANLYTYHPAHVRYQEALIYQALGDKLSAERCLEEILTNHTQTTYHAKASYDKACIIFNGGNYQGAIEAFSLLIEKKLSTDLQPELLMKRAIAYENLKKYQEAATDYTAILDQYPTHFHAESALIALSNLLAQNPEKTNSDLKKYAHILKSIKGHSDERMIDESRQLFYNQAYDKVLKKLNNFDKHHPESKLSPEAYFLMGESYYRLQQHKEAIRYYKKIVAKTDTSFHKKARLRMADLAYQNTLLQEALMHYQMLQKMDLTPKEHHQVLVGIMKTSFILKRYQITTRVCLQLLNSPKELPIEIVQQASLYLGKVTMERSEYKRARSHFLKGNKPLHTTTAAEAQYLFSYTAFKLKAYKESLDALFDLVEKFPYNAHHIDDAFLLMADNYIMLNNLPQAKATLDSMISQSTNKTKIALAKQKKAKVMERLRTQTTSKKTSLLSTQANKKGSR